MKMNLFAKKRWREREITEFSQKISSLLRAGIPFIDSMAIVADQYRGVKKDQLGEIRDKIIAGVPMADAFKCYHFPLLFVSMVGLAHKHGQLSDTFAKLGIWFQRRSNFREHLKQKMTYPLFLLVFVLLLLFYFMFYLLPQFQELLSDFDSKLPLSTSLLFSIQILLQKYYIHILFLILCAFLIFSSIYYFLNKKGKLLYLLLKLPFISGVIKLYFTNYLTSQLGLLLEAGMGIWEALIEVRKQTPNKHLAPLILEFENHILKGMPLSSINLSLPVLHNEYYRLTGLGEQLGTLGAQLILCSQLMEERIEAQIFFVLKWIEPLLLLFLGSVITFVIISIFLPITELIQSV